MRKFIRSYLPDHESIRQHRWMRPFANWLHHPNLWHLHRRSVAGGVAVGLFSGLIPGPVQMISAALLAILFRVNLPVAMATTWYSNPLTILPLFALAYELGALVTGYGGDVVSTTLAFPQMDWDNWYPATTEWLETLGKPFIVGLALFGVTLALLGYVAVRLLWRLVVVWQWKRRATKRLQHKEV